MATNFAIAIKNLSFSYDGRTVLEDVNLTIASGEFATVVGPNGGGKTTLIKLILGLFKPRSGQVQVFGKLPEAVRHRIGYLPQHLQLDPSFPVTVRDVVLMGRLGNKRSLGQEQHSDKRIAQMALQDVGLEGLDDHPFSSLSGGQLRRVLIARALCCEPDLLILDEPTVNLDPRAEKELYDTLGLLNERLTIVLVSHDLAYVTKFASQVVCVKGTVNVHPTSEVDSEVMSEIYGAEMRLVRHDRYRDNGEKM
ncbi:MAG: ABC transporter ATP-binding protein [candidate division Zixibacteria bacterium]|nr:ABC transporter ATP-binding protein [candidate division Zixibacteria bacterium]